MDQFSEEQLAELASDELDRQTWIFQFMYLQSLQVVNHTVLISTAIKILRRFYAQIPTRNLQKHPMLIYAPACFLSAYKGCESRIRVASTHVIIDVLIEYLKIKYLVDKSMPSKYPESDFDKKYKEVLKKYSQTKQSPSPMYHELSQIFVPFIIRGEIAVLISVGFDSTPVKLPDLTYCLGVCVYQRCVQLLEYSKYLQKESDPDAERIETIDESEPIASILRRASHESKKTSSPSRVPRAYKFKNKDQIGHINIDGVSYRDIEVVQCFSELSIAKQFIYGIEIDSDEAPEP
ncbi:hypothetical protein ADUPG1_007296, partial [Aduncisulcus paluster]